MALPARNPVITREHGLRLVVADECTAAPRPRAKKTWRAWTAQEKDDLETMRLDGMMDKEIAAVLGRSIDSINSQLHQLKVRAASRLQKYLPTLLDEPHSTRDAAALLGVTECAIRTARHRLRKMGYEIPRRPSGFHPGWRSARANDSSRADERAAYLG